MFDNHDSPLTRKLSRHLRVYVYDCDVLSVQLLPSYIRRLHAAKRCALTDAAVTLFKSVV